MAISTAAARSQPEAPSAGDGCVLVLFEQRARIAPEAPAVLTASEKITYGELNRRANRLAWHLRQRGLDAGMRAAVCLDRTPAMVEAVLAIFKCGATYVPLDPRYPAERLRMMIADSDFSLLITERKWHRAFDVSEQNAVCLDAEAASIAAQPDCTFDVSRRSGLAYIIYTSGTTGRPKGVMICHRNLFEYARSMAECLDVRSNDVWLHTASLAFSSSVRQIFVPLAAGAAITIASSDTIADPCALFNLVRDTGVTIIDIVPTYWKACVDALEATPPARRNRLLDNSLRLVLSASEALWSDVPRRWAAFGHPARMINMFGQTETAGIACMHPIEPADWVETRIVSIGKPIPGASVYLLDGNGQRVPQGRPGYLHVGGPCVGLGYWRLPSETADAFLTRPCCDGVIYRTGDLARELDNGEIEFIGRADNQVKIRGHRIEPAEIEAALRSHPLVADAVIKPLHRPGHDSCLGAWVVPVAGAAPNRIVLHEHLAGRLPHYMLPAFYVTLSALPLTPNGKVDRRRLPDPQPQEIPPPDSRRGDTVEEAVAVMWTDVLQTNAFGVADDFLAVGGNSLLATRLLSRIRETFLVDVPLTCFFQDRTVAGLAAALEQRECVPGNIRKIAEIVTALARLSPREAAAMLREKQEVPTK